MWDTLTKFNILSNLQHFILQAFWRKLLVVATMFSLKMLRLSDCSLCFLPEDHSHVIKRYPYPSLTFFPSPSTVGRDGA